MEEIDAIHYNEVLDITYKKEVLPTKKKNKNEQYVDTFYSNTFIKNYFSKTKHI